MCGIVLKKLLLIFSVFLGLRPKGCSFVIIQSMINACCGFIISASHFVFDFTQFAAVYRLRRFLKIIA